MYCPTCTVTPLVLAQRQNVEVDYCPHCRGVWLDRGELEKLLDRAAHGAPASAARVEDDSRLAPRARHSGRRQRRQTWLSEILD